MDDCYSLAQGTQVREEDFGLLFYTMSGPRLYFLSSGRLLGCDFFDGHITLGQWLENAPGGTAAPSHHQDLKQALAQLAHKGVILEC